jgi:hypothetical protein
MRANQLLKHAPRNVLQKIVQNAILMPHGVAPFRVQETRQRLNTSRINTVRSVCKIKPDSRGTRPAMTSMWVCLNLPPASVH